MKTVAEIEEVAAILPGRQREYRGDINRMTPTTSLVLIQLNVLSSDCAYTGHMKYQRNPLLKHIPLMFAKLTSKNIR